MIRGLAEAEEGWQEGMFFVGLFIGIVITLCGFWIWMG
jgi:hypothetical protein